MVGGINAVYESATALLGRTHASNSHSTKEMSLPVRPPILPKAFWALDAAFEIAGPAVLVTRLRPSEALEAVEEAVSFALAAVSLAVEACRNWPLKSCRDCRRATLETMGADMAVGSWQEAS